MKTSTGWPCALALWLAACTDYQLDDKRSEPAACVAPPDDAVSASVVVPVAGCRVGAVATPPAEPWSVRTLWSWPGPEDGIAGVSSNSTPVVGLLVDTDGDGTVDERDGSVVVVSFFDAVALQYGTAVLDAATGRTLWTKPDGGDVSAALADGDGDGRPEVLIPDGQTVVAFSAEGDELWRSEPAEFGCRETTAVTDLDWDGRPEVVVDGPILDGRDGTDVIALPCYMWTGTTAADLDLDGRQELLARGIVYTATGEEVWRTPEAGLRAFPVVLQADADDEAEVFWVGDESFSLSEHDGTPIVAVALDEPRAPGPPCAGDFDGDGRPEIAWADTRTEMLHVYGLDGLERWRTPLTDETGVSSSCSAFDFEADGSLEILFADGQTLHIYDGATGVAVYEDDTHRSTTWRENPVIADLDRDGHAEILLTGSADAPGVVRALTNASDGWPPAGRSWGAWDFAVTNANPTGRVPRSPEPSWLAYNMWRARPAVEGVPLADLVVSATSACNDGRRVVVSVANQGISDVPEGAVLVAFDGDTEVGRLLLPAIPTATSVVGLLVEVEAIVPGLRVVVDAEGVAAECDTGNNEASLP